MEHIAEESDQLAITARWLIDAPRASVYAIVSDFEALPRHFPALAHRATLLSRSGNELSVAVEAASFGRFFPRVHITIKVELLPGVGYRTTTFNRTFNTTGKEQLLLHDADRRTELEYTYFVTVRWQRLRPLYGWLVRRFAMSFWKRFYLQPLTKLAQARPQAAMGTAEEAHSSGGAGDV